MRRTGELARWCCGQLFQIGCESSGVPCKLNNEKHERNTKGRFWLRLKLFLKMSVRNYWDCVRIANEEILEYKLRANDSMNWFYAFGNGCLRYHLLRVWSWLRTNAGGVPNTCKSNGRGPFGDWVSGERVSNAWGTCLSVGDNSWKRLLIPHEAFRGHPLNAKDLLLKDGLASD